MNVSLRLTTIREKGSSILFIAYSFFLVVPPHHPPAQGWSYLIILRLTNLRECNPIADCIYLGFNHYNIHKSSMLGLNLTLKKYLGLVQTTKGKLIKLLNGSGTII